MPDNITFQEFLDTAFVNELWSTDEVIEFVLPLFEEVLGFHENGQVASFELPDSIFLTEERLDIDENHAHKPVYNQKALNKLTGYRAIDGYTVTEQIKVDEDLGNFNNALSNVQVAFDPVETLTQPAYLRGYTCYEQLVGHHDAQTDIFCLGLILGSCVMGLNLYEEEDLNRFAAFRTQPAGLNGRIHATVCALVAEMTALDRKERSRDMREIIQRLRFYRDYDPQRETDLSALAAFREKKPKDRKAFILSRLRNRLFDSTRRNRLLYYKPNQRFVNLTVSSVPMVLHFQSVNPLLLFTWNTEIAKLVSTKSSISLNKYLRFEDHTYLNAQLNSIRLQSDKDVKEYGFSQLKLAVAFLQWHNLKEDAGERIHSPLLLLPVKLERKKALKEERFTLDISDNTAVINPVLAHNLKELYGIALPETIELDEQNMLQFFELLKQKVDDARQGVKLNYINKPRVRLVHTAARQTINTYRKRLKQKGSPSFHQVDYSYSEEYYKPLGLELFRKKVEPKPSALEFLLGGKPDTHIRSYFADTATEIKSRFELVDGDSNPYSWDFDVCNIVLGNFNYKKMSLVSDYNKVAENGIDHPVFNQLFSPAPRSEEAMPVGNSPSEWYHVITADPTQAKAVLQSRSGKSYIIQGPPGTGKSQTITNLIADFLARNKTILFVCEKRAALDVVYHRLQQHHLSELCCYIHDSQGDKKEFIRDLRTIYEDFREKRMDLRSISLQRKMVLDKLVQQIDILAFYHRQQQKVFPEAGTSTRNLIEVLLDMKDHLPRQGDLRQQDIPGYSEWVRFGETIAELGKALENTGAEPVLAAHPFKSLGTGIVHAENPFKLVDSILSHATQAIQLLTQAVQQHRIPLEHATTLENIRNLIQDSVIMEELALSRNLQLVDMRNEAAAAFEQQYSQFRALQLSYEKMLETNKRWVNKFDPRETVEALALAEKHEKSFFGFLNGNWRKLKKQLLQSYDFSSHQLRPSFSFILQQLQEEYKQEEQARAKKAEIQAGYRMDNIDRVYVGINVLRRKQGDREIDYLLQHPGSNELVLQLSRLNNVLMQLEVHLQQCLYDYSTKSLSSIKDELATIGSNAGVLKELLPVLKRFSGLPEALQAFVRTVPLTPLQAQAVMADTTLRLLLQENSSFQAINDHSLQDSVQAIEKLYKELLKLNSDYIRAEKRARFLKNYDISNGPAIGLTEQERAFKKMYTEGRRVLEHEMGKTMRYKSIRELASNESGSVLKDIKPVWLMSPLSVSDSLPLDTGYFDVVIYDEASQITLEEGIPALFRAPQTIIVGDDKQMPPSNFFNAKSEDPEDLETFEGEQEDEILSADADSLLVQAARKLNSTMLSWHYRSRYETLISYSNHAFYQAGLLTIPDRTIHHKAKPLLEVRQPSDGITNASVLTRDSMSFHYFPSSVYEARSNSGEAGYIAYLVKKLLMDNIPDSIGIVAFSQEQQGVIEDAIGLMAEKDKAFDEALEKAYNRTDDGQFTGLFVKNLENVQGDERDIIIMSVCYGHDSNKKMLMNFGPINRKGGEKRLNVIFSRARKHMAVVSSIKHSHITNTYNEGANYFSRFLHYAEMVSTGDMQTARRILDTLVPGDQAQQELDPGSLAAAQIKNALQEKGYFVDQAVGQSSFKCSLGVRLKAADDQYALGILIDDAAHYRNDDLVEQYCQRPSILQSFGWKIMSVFAKDWLEDNERILYQIISKLEHAHNAVAGDTKENSVNAGDTSSSTPGLKPNTQMLHSSDKEKFYEITRDRKELHIRTGKNGTRGVMQIRSFESENEAIQAFDNCISEQIEAGYLLKLS